MPRKRKPNPVRSRRRSWTAEDLALLGTLPDNELAKKLGRCQANIRERRMRLGIPLYLPGPTTKWTPAQLQLLANNDDARVVQLTGKKMVEVQAKRKSLAY